MPEFRYGYYAFPSTGIKGIKEKISAGHREKVILLTVWQHFH